MLKNSKLTAIICSILLFIASCKKDEESDSKTTNNPNPVTVTPTCSDGIQNQGETSVDCGGPCPACETMTLKVDGYAFDADSIVVKYELQTGTTNIYEYHVYGYSNTFAPGSPQVPCVQLDIPDWNTGTYCMINNPSLCDVNGHYKDPNGWNSMGISGTMNITSVDSVNKIATGNFNFVSQTVFMAQFQITNGNFVVHY